MSNTESILAVQDPVIDGRYLQADIPVFLIRCLAATLQDFGHDPERTMQGLGVTLSDLADPSCRLSYRQGRQIIRRALALAPEVALGLETGKRETIASIGLVGFAMITSPTVGSAIQLGLELQRDTGSMLEFGLRDASDVITFTATARFDAPDIYPFLVDEAFASFLQVGRGLVGQGFTPIRIDVTFPEPVHASAYTDLFQCPVRFGSKDNAFLCARHWLEMPLLTSDPLSHRQVIDFLKINRHRVDEASEIIASVERVLRHDLRLALGLEEVAARLNLSERTLRRRLADSGTSFRHLLDRCRKARALELLNNPALSIERIALAVGFNDHHNFRRAFRRWTGLAPGVFRSKGN
ncbi:AraC family transcriptional regulator [Pseudomonas oryzihabitans]|uniref:AraC family transcriptional regulator n=1 Tax=Pseudomonas oryzihabitans TaxID=47885 RepID=UPI001642E42B|nr:AraC family transcriptional regulator [Pseudomonas oryzihabitans]